MIGSPWNLAIFGRRAVVISAIAVTAAGILFLARYIRQDRGGSFDPAAWKRAVQCDPSIRKRMAQVIISNKILLGATRDEVIRLLGPPDRIGRYAQAANDIDWNYYCGPEDGFIRIDSQWLTIQFKDGKVSRVLLTTD